MNCQRQSKKPLERLRAYCREANHNLPQPDSNTARPLLFASPVTARALVLVVSINSLLACAGTSALLAAVAQVSHTKGKHSNLTRTSTDSEIAQRLHGVSPPFR